MINRWHASGLLLRWLTDLRIVVDLVTQLVPVGSALAGVALTFAGNAWLERRKWHRTQAAEHRVRSLQAFADLLQSVTDIARTLRQSAERLASRGDLDADALADVVSELIGQTRQHATIARLVGPLTAYPLIKEIEDLFARLYQTIKGVRGAEDTAVLVDPARKLMKLHDELISQLRQDDDRL